MNFDLTGDFASFGFILLSFGLGFFLTMEVRHRFKKAALVNEVTDRSCHTVPTLRGGGLAIAILTLVGFFGLLGFGVLPNDPFLWALAGSSTLIATLGLWDDIKDVPARIRMPLQMIAIGFCLYFLPPIFTDFIPLWAEKIILLLAWGWFLNLYNFMDGLDGYAGQQTVFLAVAMAVLVLSPLKPLFLIIAGATLGFLCFNWHPAKIFMGDVGSTFLGFLFGGLLFWHTTPEGLPILFTLPLLFTADATYTLIKRIIQGKKPWQAHREHWYQRAYRAGLSHSTVSGIGVRINIALFCVCAFTMNTPYAPFAPVLGLAALAFIAYRIKNRE